MLEQPPFRPGGPILANAGHRIIITLECQACKRRNYSTMKNRRNTPEKIAVKKYCSSCRSHSEHKETK